MKTKITMITLIGMVLTLAMSSVLWAGPIGGRVHHQRERIIDGIQSGEITRWEHDRLKREQRQIHRVINHARADGRIEVPSAMPSPQATPAAALRFHR